MGYGQYSNRPFMARQRERRHLAGYRECVAEWLSQRSDSGKTGGGRMYFTGATLYSYGEHYPMARIIGEGLGCLVNCDSNSATTNKHMSIVRQMVSSAFHSSKVFYLPTHVLTALQFSNGSLKSHAEAFSYYRSIAEEQFERSVNREEASRDAMRHLETANRYADFYGLQRPFNAEAAPEAVRFAFALGDESGMVAYLVKEPK